MWRLAVAVSLLFTLALAGAADGKCRVCVDSVTAGKVDGGTALTFGLFTPGDVRLPDTVTAVVMQVDGAEYRAKCVNVTLARSDLTGGRASYSGVFTPLAGKLNDSFSGRVDVAGEIWEFVVSVDGRPGIAQLVASAPPAAPAAPVVITAAPAPSAQPAAVAAAPEPAPAPAIAVVRLDQVNPVALLGLIVVLATALGAYVDRRRSLARAAAA